MNKNEVDDIAKAMSILSVSKDFEVTKDMLLHIVSLMNKHNKLSIGLDELILELHEIFVKDKSKSNFSPEYKFTSPSNINLQDTTNDIKTVPNFNDLNGSKNLTENMNSLHLDKEFIKSDIVNDNDNTNSNETKTSSEMNIDSKVEFSLGAENISTRLTTRSSARKSKIKTHITNKNSANLDSDIFGTTSNSKTNPLPELDPLNLPFSSPLKTELPEIKANFKIESNFINSNLLNDTVSNISILNPNLENLKNVSTPLNSHNYEFRGNNNSFSDNNMETPLSNAMDTSNSSHTDTNTPYVATTPSNNTFLFSFGDNSNASVILDKSNNDIFFSPGISDQPSIKTINKKVKPTSNKKIIKPRSTRNTPSSSRVNRKFKLNDDDDDDNINEEGARDDQNTLNTNIDTMNTFSANFNKENDINSTGFNNPFKGDTDNLHDFKGSSINLETPTTLKSPTRSTTEKSNSSIDDHDDSNIDHQIEKKNRPQEVSFSLPNEPIKSYLDFKINHCYSNNTPDSTSISKNNKYFYDKESTHVDESLAVLADMYRKQGRDFYANEDYVNALDSFSKALTQAPFNWVHKVAVLGNRAATYMMLNRFTDVINDCNDAIKLDNTVLKLYSRKARAFLRLGYISESEEIFQYLSKINNSSSDADIINEAAQYIDLITTLKDNLLLLVTYDNSNKYEEVIKISDEILQTCTYSFNTIKSKANALFKLSKFTETKQFIESIFCNIHISIINTLIYNNMNITVPNENDLQWVIKNNKIVIHKDSVVNFLLCLGRDISHIYINSLKNHEYNYLLSTSIMEEINQIIQQLYSRTTPNNLNNDNSWDWINLEKKKIDKLKSNKLSGDNSFRLKKYYEALHFYTLAVEIDSNALIWKAILFNNRAASYMGIDLFKEALNDCNDSIACDNKYYKAYLRRARVYRSLNQYLESVADYRTYLKSIQNDITKVNEYNEISSECNEYVQAQAFRGKQNNNRWDRSPGKKGSGDYTTFEKKSHDFKYGNMESDEEDDDCGWFDNSTKYSSYTKPQSPNAKAYNNHNNKGFYTNNYGSSKPNNYRNDTKPSNNRTNAGYNSYFKYNYSNKSSNDNTTTQPIDEDDLYHILNVTNKATEREIKLSYRKLALQFHPDKNKDDGAEDKFKKITTAYATLSDKFGLQPLISTQFTSKLISKSSIVIVTELTKVLLCFSSISLESKETKKKIIASWNLLESLQIAALPAILYAIQNMLVQKGYTLVDSMTFNLLNQTKTLCAAFFLWVILGQKQSLMQIFALFLLLAAAMILNLGPKANQSIASIGTSKLLDSNYQLGVLVVLGASLTSGICAALIQKAFTLPTPRHPLLYSSELAIYGIITLCIHDLMSGQNTFMKDGGLFANWDMYAIIPVTTNAFGGLIVGLVSKYAGGVVKGFALIAGLLVTALAQWLIEKKPLGIEHGISAVLVSLSIIIHSSYPIKKIKDKTK